MTGEYSSLHMSRNIRNVDRKRVKEYAVQNERLRAQSFVPTSVDQPDANMPASHTLDIRITATQDEVMLWQERKSGAMIRARIGERPLVPTRMRVESVDMTLNRFSGRMKTVWGVRNVRDFKPRGAIKPTKVSYLDSKTFDAKCHTMKERLF